MKFLSLFFFATIATSAIAEDKVLSHAGKSGVSAIAAGVSQGISYLSYDKAHSVNQNTRATIAAGHSTYYGRKPIANYELEALERKIFAMEEIEVFYSYSGEANKKALIKQLEDEISGKQKSHWRKVSEAKEELVRVQKLRPSQIEEHMIYKTFDTSKMSPDEVVGKIRNLSKEGADIKLVMKMSKKNVFKLNLLNKVIRFTELATYGAILYTAGELAWAGKILYDGEERF